MSYNTPSMFTGAGPRLGLKGQYALGDFQFIGEVAGAGLIGTSQARINVSTISPAIVGPNNQSLTSPNATQVVPSFDARLATAYAFPASNYGQFKIEAGYQAAVYFNAVSHYALTSVPTAPMVPPVGISPVDGATPAKQFHGPRSVCDGQLVVLAERATMRRAACILLSSSFQDAGKPRGHGIHKHETGRLSKAAPSVER